MPHFIKAGRFTFHAEEPFIGRLAVLELKCEVGEPLDVLHGERDLGPGHAEDRVDPRTLQLRLRHVLHQAHSRLENHQPSAGRDTVTSE